MTNTDWNAVNIVNPQGQGGWLLVCEHASRRIPDALDGLGFPTERRARRLSHWTPYLRGGLFDFYRAALCHPWALPLGLLRHNLPTRPHPRWSRLLAPTAGLGEMRA